MPIFDPAWLARVETIELPPKPPLIPVPPMQGPPKPKLWCCVWCASEYRGYRHPEYLGWKLTAPHGGDILCASCAQEYEATFNSFHVGGVHFKIYT